MSQIIVGNDIALHNGLVNQIQSVNSNTSITSTSGPSSTIPSIIGVHTNSGAITITLPGSSGNGLVAGRTYVIFDQDGSAQNNNITIDAGSGISINGSQTTTINQNYGSLTVICVSSTQWAII